MVVSNPSVQCGTFLHLSYKSYRIMEDLGNDSIILHKTVRQVPLETPLSYTERGFAILDLAIMLLQIRYILAEPFDMERKHPGPVFPTVLAGAEQGYVLETHLLAFANEVLGSRKEFGVR